MLNTPVLLIIFNRPETTRQVFGAIRMAQPKQLFIAADGPREDREGEKERCEQARSVVTAIDWDCEVHTHFRGENLGCGRGPVDAISWFFEQVEKGIILEDDCLPDQSFFRFCEELLIKYKDDEKVQMIAGTNLLKEWKNNNDSYFFSLQSGIWGWATWKRAWVQYDFYASKWKDQKLAERFRSSFTNPNELAAYESALNKTIQSNDVSWWDYQWVFSRISSSQVGIIPSVNLIPNIGFGANATHTFDKNSTIGNLRTYEASFPLTHPRTVTIDSEYEAKLSATFYPMSGRTSLLGKMKSLIRKVF